MPLPWTSTVTSIGTLARQAWFRAVGSFWASWKLVPFQYSTLETEALNEP